MGSDGSPRKSDTSKSTTKKPRERSSKRIDKQKKSDINGAHKDSLRNYLHLQAQDLETQAHKLLEEARKARARADLLDKLEIEEDEEMNKLKEEIKNAGEDEAQALPTGDAQLRDAVLDRIMEKELGPSITAERKSKTKEEKRGSKRKRETAEVSTEEPPPTETTEVDTKARDEDETRVAKEKRREKKKNKKRKLEKSGDDNGDGGNDNGNDEAVITITKKDKKDKKKKKEKKKEKEKAREDEKKKAANENETTEQSNSNEAPKGKKHKRNSDKKDEKPVKEHTSAAATAAAPTEGGANTHNGEQWNVSALEGDAKRKQKFLRLLGGGKKVGSEGGAGSASTSSPSNKAGIAKMQADLERQFDSGIKMKQEGHSHRKGLGA